MDIVTIVALVLDLLVAAILVGFVLSGMHKGFLVSLVNAVGYLVSCAGAYIGSRVLALTVYQMFLRDRLIATVNEALRDTVADADITAQVADAMQGIPGILRNMVYGFFGDSGDISRMLEEEALSAASSVSVTITDQVLYPVIFVVLQSLLFLLLFAALRVILSAISETLRNLRKFPLVGMADTLAGAGLGLLQAVLVLCVVVLVSRLLISLSGGRIPVFNEETIGHSYVFRWLYTFNPFSGGWTALH